MPHHGGAWQHATMNIGHQPTERELEQQQSQHHPVKSLRGRAVARLLVHGAYLCDRDAMKAGVAPREADPRHRDWPFRVVRSASQPCGFAASADFTTTFPTMWGWMEQKYSYSPGAANVKE